jgi:hypothetical protein
MCLFGFCAAWGGNSGHDDDDENRPLWVEDWDDQEVAGPDFQSRLKSEQDKSSMKE